MSKINSGILGPYSGRLGDTVGYRREGQNVIQAIRKVASINSMSNLVQSNLKAKTLDFQINLYKRIWPQLNTLLSLADYPSFDILFRTNYHKINIDIPYVLFGYELQPRSLTAWPETLAVFDTTTKIMSLSMYYTYRSRIAYQYNERKQALHFLPNQTLSLSNIVQSTNTISQGFSGAGATPGLYFVRAQMLKRSDNLIKQYCNLMGYFNLG